MKQKAIKEERFKLNTRKEYETLVKLNKKRLDLKLNPICPACARVMRTMGEHKYHAEYYCVCNRDIILSMG